jgi:hypothetical protein
MVYHSPTQNKPRVTDVHLEFSAFIIRVSFSSVLTPSSLSVFISHFISTHGSHSDFSIRADVYLDQTQRSVHFPNPGLAPPSYSFQRVSFPHMLASSHSPCHSLLPSSLSLSPPILPSRLAPQPPF